MARGDPALRLIASLKDPKLYGDDVGSVRLIETHISWVLLTGKRAFKIKKPLKLPFLDFSTLEARAHYCNEELRLNRRLAPELYIGVLPISGTPARPRIGGRPAIEYCVEMVEFPAEARLDRRIAASDVGDTQMLELAELIAHFHATLPPAGADSEFGTAAAVRAGMVRNLAELSAAIPQARGVLTEIGNFLTAQADRLAPAFSLRKDAGAVREGHGDLHLENLVYWGSRILPFDALEFDPALRWIDVIDEAAFLTMDLMAHGRRDLAFRFLNRYLECTADYRGLTVLPCYLIHRALVRAKVRAIKAHQDRDASVGRQSGPYLDVASELVAAHRPLLLITHGLSGSGKTTWTERLIPALPAIRLRSDVVRKRLVGLDERAASHSPVGGGLYAAGPTDATYGALERGARAGLEAGFDVIVDAAFLQARQRAAFVEVAAETGAAFAILDCRAPLAALRKRIRARQARETDASEAGLDVLEHQIQTRDALSPSERSRAVRLDTHARPAVERLVAEIRSIGC